MNLKPFVELSGYSFIKVNSDLRLTLVQSCRLHQMLSETPLFPAL